MPKAKQLPRLESRNGTYYIVGNWAGRSNRISTRTSDYASALHALSTFLEQETAGWGKAAVLTVKAAAEYYADAKGIDLKTDLYCRQFLRILGGLPAKSINPAICREYLAQRQSQVFTAINWHTGKPIKASTVRRELTALRAVLNMCNKEGLLDHPANVWLPPEGRPREKRLERHEATALLAECNAHSYLYVLLALGTGARNGALLGLKWERITLPVGNNQGRIDMRNFDIAQNNKRRGIVPLLADSELAYFLGLAKEAADTEYVVEYMGKPIKNTSLALELASKRAGIQRVTPHMLKHTAITWMLEDGVPISDVADYTQTSEKTIMETYGHWTQNRGIAAAKATQFLRKHGSSPKAFVPSRQRSNKR